MAVDTPVNRNTYLRVLASWAHGYSRPPAVTKAREATTLTQFRDAVVELLIPVTPHMPLAETQTLVSGWVEQNFYQGPYRIWEKRPGIPPLFVFTPPVYYDARVHVLRVDVDILCNSDNTRFMRGVAHTGCRPRTLPGTTREHRTQVEAAIYYAKRCWGDQLKQESAAATITYRPGRAAPSAMLAVLTLTEMPPRRIDEAPPTELVNDAIGDIGIPVLARQELDIYPARVVVHYCWICGSGLNSYATPLAACPVCHGAAYDWPGRTATWWPDDMRQLSFAVPRKLAYEDPMGFGRVSDRGRVAEYAAWAAWKQAGESDPRAKDRRTQTVPQSATISRQVQLD